MASYTVELRERPAERIKLTREEAETMRELGYIQPAERRVQRVQALQAGNSPRARRGDVYPGVTRKKVPCPPTSEAQGT